MRILGDTFQYLSHGGDRQVTHPTTLICSLPSLSIYRITLLVNVFDFDWVPQFRMWRMCMLGTVASKGIKTALESA